MLRKTTLILLALVVGRGTGLAQSGRPADSMAYAIRFSMYLSHIDRFGAAFDVVTDSKGYIYVSGNTRDRNFPTTEGAFQRELKGEADAFVAKFTPEGTIVFATLIGGTKREHHTGLAVDTDGYVYLVGGTHSADFPVTSGACDTSFNGEKDWGGDVYVTKINPSGSGLVFSTFIGGSAQETARGIALDLHGNVVIAGATLSPDFPVTDGTISRRGAGQDAFLAKFSADGNSLMFASLIGGNGQDGLTGLAIDNRNNIYVSGYTASSDLPATADAVRKTVELADKGGFENGMDLFLAKINESGTALVYLSYIGGGSYLSTDLNWTRPGRLMIYGSTNTKSLPLSDRAYAREAKGERDGFVSIFNSENMAVEYSTLFGGSQFDFVRSAFFLDEDRIVLSGETNSPDFPLTENALYAEYPICDKTFNNTFFGKRRFFVSVVDIKQGRLAYSTFFGSGVRFQVFPDSHGNLAFIAEAGVREAPGTDFPVSGDDSRVPPTYIMLGRLVPIGHAQTTPEAGPYLGQNPPGTTPVIFAPGLVSTGNIHSRLEISPDGQEMLWNTVDMKTFSTHILSVKNVSGTWSAPQPPPFAKDGNTQGAVFSPDGKTLFFSVNAGDGWARKYVDKTETGWSAARAGGVLPSGSSSFTRSGRVYLSREMTTKVWNTGIFEARYGPDGYADVTALGEAINRPNAIDYTPYVSPDESFLLLSSNRPLNGDKEEMSIHVSFRKPDGTWSAPQQVSRIPGRFPSLSPDGKYLFFCGDDGNIYWADATILDPLRDATIGSARPGRASITDACLMAVVASGSARARRRRWR